MHNSNDYRLGKLRISFIFTFSILVVESAWLTRVLAEPALTPMLGTVLFGLGAAIAILIYELIRPPVSKRQESVFIVLQTLAAGLAILAAHGYYLAAGVPIVYPYVGAKLLVLCLALSTPPPTTLTWVSFAVFAFGPGLQSLYWSLSGEQAFGEVEPWLNMLFTGFAVVLWHARWSLQRNYNRLLWLESRASSLEKLAHLLLGARHLQNSALQVIESHTALIELDYPQAKNHTEPIQRAISQIVRLTAALEVHDDQATWGEFAPPQNHREFELRLMDFNNGKNGSIPEI